MPAEMQIADDIEHGNDAPDEPDGSAEAIAARDEAKIGAGIKLPGTDRHYERFAN